nr:hypothetical protein [uncultured Devosia sp.]
MARQRETFNPWQHESVFVYAAVRAKHVSQEIAELEMRLDALKEEEAVLADLMGGHKSGTATRKRSDAAPSVPPRAHTAQSSVRSVVGTPDVPSAEPKPEKGPTLKSLAIEVLKKHPAGLGVAELEKLIESEFGRTMAPKSLSPQLKRLEQNGVLQHEGKTWSLVVSAA